MSANGSVTPPVDAYRTTGTSPGPHYLVQGPPHAPPVVVLGGISADKHVGPGVGGSRRGWWSGVVGPSSALDPGRYRLIGIDWLGGPARALPSGRGVSTTEQADEVVKVLDRLQIRRASIVGASYGGMVALALAAAHPERVDRLVLLCAAHRAHPMATAWRSIQRRLVRFAQEVDREASGLQLARALAMTTYRSADEFEARFGVAPCDGVGAQFPLEHRCFPVEEYLVARGADFATRFDARSFLTLSESIDTHRIDPAAITAPSVLVSFDTDTLVPSWLVQELADSLGGRSRHVRIPSLFGHDAFLKEVTAVSAVIADALRPPPITVTTPRPVATTVGDVSEVAR